MSMQCSTILTIYVSDHLGCQSSLNQTYVECTFRCPSNVCPSNDWPLACKPPRNCPGGCGCLPGYRWNENNECILAEECRKRIFVVKSIKYTDLGTIRVQ